MRRFAANDAGNYEPSLGAIKALSLPERSSLTQALLANSERLLARSAEKSAAERTQEVARLEGKAVAFGDSHRISLERESISI